jgi:hypothetical protein
VSGGFLRRRQLWRAPCARVWQQFLTQSGTVMSTTHEPMNQPTHEPTNKHAKYHCFFEAVVRTP